MQNKEKVINGINYLVGSNCRCSVRMSLYFIVTKKKKEKKRQMDIGQRRNLKSRLFKELNQPIDYTPKYTFKR
jgi:hypothetical protein